MYEYLVRRVLVNGNKTDDKSLVNHFPPVSKAEMSKILNDMLDKFRTLGGV